MTKKIKLKTKTQTIDSEQLRVRIIRAPIVNQDDLRSVILGRAKAIVL